MTESRTFSAALILFFLVNGIQAFLTPGAIATATRSILPKVRFLTLSNSNNNNNGDNNDLKQHTPSILATSSSPSDPMEDALDELSDATKEMSAKARRAQALREQEVFMKLSTGKHRCVNCDWLYDETKGDSMMIGGMIKPDTKFTDLPADWRCPVCRASKDAFDEIVEEIPGFEVNQGYGFGTNSWSAGQKNLAIFGGLAVFFLLFLSGYAMS